MTADLFKQKANKSDWSDDEWSIRMEFLAALMEVTSKGGCPSCTRARLLEKYMKKHKSYLEDKKRRGQGD